MKILAGKNYYEDLLQTIPMARNRIVITAMQVQYGHETGEILDLVKIALSRGVRVHILADVYSNTPLAYGELIPGSATKKSLQKTKDFFEDLHSIGARITWWGKIGLNPFKHRDHVKAVVVDDNVYTFGGINFWDKGLKAEDYMLKHQSSKLADEIEKLVAHIADGKDRRDFAHPLDRKNMLLYDSGIPKKSMIYDEACRLAQNADRIYYVSQMCPSGELAGYIRQNNYTCYFNRPAQMSFPANLQTLVDQAKYEIKNSYKKSTFIHAKFILFELKDGKKALISGSNNFAWRGVSYGTKEIALLSYDEQLWNDLYKFVDLLAA